MYEEIREAAQKGKAVSVLCDWLGVNRAGYYRWRAPRPTQPVEMELRDAMQPIAVKFPA